MAQETQGKKLSPEMQAWRDACKERFDHVADHLFHGHLEKFYKHASRVRPLVNAGLEDALNYLFDPDLYPYGMRMAEVNARAETELAPRFEGFFTPHRDAMLLEGKWNYRKGKPAKTISWNNVDHTMVLYAPHLCEEMQAAGQEVRARFQAPPKHVEVETNPFPGTKLVGGVVYVPETLRSSGLPFTPIILGPKGGEPLDVNGRPELKYFRQAGAASYAYAYGLKPAVEALLPALPSVKEHDLDRKIFQIMHQHNDPRPKNTMQSYVDWLQQKGPQIIDRQLRDLDGLSDKDRQALGALYRDSIPSMVEKVYALAALFHQTQHELPRFADAKEHLQR